MVKNLFAPLKVFIKIVLAPPCFPLAPTCDKYCLVPNNKLEGKGEAGGKENGGSIKVVILLC